MKELLEIFSLSNKGDVPIGLKRYKVTPKLNQPSLAEQKSFNFNNFISYSSNNSFEMPLAVEEERQESKFSLLDFIFGDDEDEDEDECCDEFF